MHIEFLDNYRIKIPIIIILGILISFSLTGCMGRAGNPQGWAGGVIVDDNLVTASMDGQLVSLNVDTGKQNWEPHMIRVTDDDDDRRAIYATPAVYNGVAFVASYDGKIHAISLSDGSLIDSVTLDSSFIGGISISEDNLFVVSEVGVLYGYRILVSVETQKVSLEPLWNPILIADGVWSTPLVHGEHIYVTSLDHYIYAIDVVSGEEIWNFDTQGAIVSSPILYQDNLMFGSFDGNFYSLNPDTGKENWIFKGSNHWYWADPVVGYDEETPLVFASSLGGSIYAIQTQTGVQQWESNIESVIVGAPAIVKDMLVFGSRDETVYVSEISSGITLGTCDIGDKVETPITVINDIVFFGARDHSIRALKIKQNGNWDSPYFSDKAKERKNPYVLDWVPGC